MFMTSFIPVNICAFSLPITLASGTLYSVSIGFSIVPFALFSGMPCLTTSPSEIIFSFQDTIQVDSFSTCLPKLQLQRAASLCPLLPSWISPMDLFFVLLLGACVAVCFPPPKSQLWVSRVKSQNFPASRRVLVPLKSSYGRHYVF